MINAAAVCLSKMATVSHGRTAGSSGASRVGVSADSVRARDCLTIQPAY